MKTCKQCGKELVKNKVYCSKECRNKYLSLHPFRPKKQVSVTCEECGKQFTRRPSNLRKRTFCSKACHLATHGKNKYEIRKCEECDKDIKVLISGRKGCKKTFCSYECHNNWRRKHQRGKQHHQYKRVNTQCAQCGKPIAVIPAKFKINKHCFCGNKCRYAWNKKAMTGSNNPAWQGGYDEYYGPNWIEQRTKTKQRDNHTCQECGLQESHGDQTLQVHHIIPFRVFNGNWDRANALSNLITLCQRCHKIIEWKTNRR